MVVDAWGGAVGAHGQLTLASPAGAWLPGGERLGTRTLNGAAAALESGVLAGDDPEIMAAQLCLPISTWISLCDREPEREPEVMDLVEKHIRQFFRVYGK